MPLGFDQPPSVAAKAFCRSLRIVSSEKIWVSARKRHRIKGLKRGASLLAMPLLLELVRAIGEHGENFDEHMVAAKAEGRRPRRHSRGSAPEFVGEERATRRDRGLHRLDEDADAAAVERRKPAEQVSINARCPLTIYASNAVSEAP